MNWDNELMQQSADCKKMAANPHTGVRALYGVP